MTHTVRGQLNVYRVCQNSSKANKSAKVRDSNSYTVMFACAADKVQCMKLG